MTRSELEELLEPLFGDAYEIGYAHAINHARPNEKPSRVKDGWGGPLALAVEALHARLAENSDS